MKYTIIESDITEIPADAIVLPANSKLLEGAGSSKAIFQAAGRKKLASACKKIGYCMPGNVAVTSAYKLPSNYIIHTVVPKWIDGSHDEYDTLCAAYLNTLAMADHLECESVAFPLLASGNNGFDFSLALEIATKSIESFEGENLKNVIIVIYGEHTIGRVIDLGYTISPKQTIVEDESIINKIKEKLPEDFIDNQIKKALEWFNKKENRDYVIKICATIMSMVLKKFKKNNPV